MFCRGHCRQKAVENSGTVNMSLAVIVEQTLSFSAFLWALNAKSRVTFEIYRMNVFVKVNIFCNWLRLPYYLHIVGFKWKVIKIKNIKIIKQYGYNKPWCQANFLHTENIIFMTIKGRRRWWVWQRAVKLIGRWLSYQRPTCRLTTWLVSDG